jgi:putative transposase
MLVHQAFRYELAPTAAQRAALTNHAGAARWAWNWGLVIRRKVWQRRRQTLNAMDLHRLLNRLKRTARYGWLYEVSKCAPQEALRDLDRAYANWWRSHKQGRRVGRPRFKKKGRCPERFRLTGAIRVEQDSVVLPRIGRVRTKEATGKFCGRILSATCRREADRRYVALTVEVARPDPVTVTGPVVDVDRGIRTFAVCSDGTRIDSPRALRVACAGCGAAAGRSPASSLARPTAVGRCWRWPAATAASATSASTRCTRPPRHWREPSR